MNATVLTDRRAAYRTDEAGNAAPWQPCAVCGHRTPREVCLACTSQHNNTESPCQ